MSAIIVTRGDVDCDEIVNSFPPEWETILWDNGAKMVLRWPTPGELIETPCDDLAVYGRYAAIAHATHDLCYVQDDDCIVSDPQAIVKRWEFEGLLPEGTLLGTNFVVCNMPPEFRHDFYTEHALVGFGAVFHRDAPARAFKNWPIWPGGDIDFFHRTCDIVFTALTPRVLVDVPYTNLWWAEDPSRMYRQEKHIEERARMLDLVRKIV